MKKKLLLVFSILYLSGCQTIFDDQCSDNIGKVILSPLVSQGTFNPNILFKEIPTIDDYLFNDDRYFSNMSAILYLDKLINYIDQLGDYSVNELSNDLFCAGIPEYKSNKLLYLVEVSSLLNAIDDDVKGRADRYKDIESRDDQWLNILSKYKSSWSYSVDGSKWFLHDLVARGVSSSDSVLAIFIIKKTPKGDSTYHSAKLMNEHGKSFRLLGYSDYRKVKNFSDQYYIFTFQVDSYSDFEAGDLKLSLLFDEGRSVYFSISSDIFLNNNLYIINFNQDY